MEKFSLKQKIIKTLRDYTPFQKTVTYSILPLVALSLIYQIGNIITFILQIPESGEGDTFVKFSFGFFGILVIALYILIVDLIRITIDKQIIDKEESEK